MPKERAVDYSTFVTLDGLALCRYMEPLINDPATTVSKEVLSRMLSELPTYDEYHLVYAIELGCKQSPETFAVQLPLYLTHDQGSVWSAAFRNLEQLPEKYVTETLVDSLRRVRTLHPEKKWIGEVVEKLEIRLGEKRGDH